MALVVSSHHVPHIAVGAAEAVGAILVQPPRTRVAGAALLVLSLLVAAALHVMSGEPPPMAFLVYVAAIAVVTKSC
jgi:hypothetical protein